MEEATVKIYIHSVQLRNIFKFLRPYENNQTNKGETGQCICEMKWNSTVKAGAWPNGLEGLYITHSFCLKQGFFPYAENTIIGKIYDNKWKRKSSRSGLERSRGGVNYIE